MIYSIIYLLYITQFRRLDISNGLFYFYKDPVFNETNYRYKCIEYTQFKPYNKKIYTLKQTVILIEFQKEAFRLKDYLDLATIS